MTSAIAVTLNITDASGAPLQDGMAYIFPTAVLTDSSDNLLLSQRPVAVDFNPTTSTQFGPAGFPVVTLPLYTDQAGVSPSGWSWQIVFKGDSMPPSQTFSLLTAGGTAQNFSALATTQNAATYQAYMPLPTGTPTSGQVPVATGSGEGSAWESLPAATTSVPGIVELASATPQPTSSAGVAGNSGLAADGLHVHAQNWLGMFGDASDGAVTLDGTATYATFSTTTGSAPNLVYTLTRDVYATNFTLNANVTLKWGNFRIFCRGTLTLNGILSSSANNASGASPGAAVGSGTLGGGQAGATGGTGVGGIGSEGNGTFGTGNGGAGGGSGASGGNNAGGGTTTAKTGIAPMRLAMAAYVGAYWGKVSASALVLEGGCGGSSGGGDGSNSGGGGGSGGNSFIALAWTVVLGSTLVVNMTGGTGGTPPAGNCGGGGGGGGGNFIINSLTAWTNNGATINQGGGSPGSGIGTGAAGSSGTSGTTLNVVVT